MPRPPCSAASRTHLRVGDHVHLALGEHNVRDLTAHLGLAQSTVSAHLRCLLDCGMVVRAQGRASVYRTDGGARADPRSSDDARVSAAATHHSPATRRSACLSPIRHSLGLQGGATAMSDACGCGHDEARGPDEQGRHLAEKLAGQRDRVRRHVRHMLLLGSWMTGPPARRGCGGFLGAWRCSPARTRSSCPGRPAAACEGQDRRRDAHDDSGAGGGLLGEVGRAAMLAFLFSISEGLEEYSLVRTRQGLRALLGSSPTRRRSSATVPRW